MAKRTEDTSSSMKGRWNNSLQVKAQEELNEKPAEVEAHLKVFRRWLDTVKHFNCPKDDDFLLAFLRHAKYEHSKAQTRLDNYCSFYSSPTLGMPDWFQTYKGKADKLSRGLDQRVNLPLGFLGDSGPFVFLQSMRNIPNLLEIMEEVVIFNTTLLDAMVYDPAVVVSGIIFVIDLSGISVSEMLKTQDAKRDKASLKYFQECMPLRLKRVIYVNEPPIFDAMMAVWEKLISKKIKDRMLTCKNNYDKIYEAYPELKKMLPKEIGGEEKTYEEIYQHSDKILSEYVGEYSRRAISSDDSKRPSSSTLSKYDSFDLEGTYIKIDSQF